MARLPRLVVRGRALEIQVDGDVITGDLTERYGYVNRSLPDSELYAFVDRLATRIASFECEVITEIKGLVNLASLPPDSDLKPEWEAFIKTSAAPTAQARIKFFLDKGFRKPGDLEEHLNHYTATYSK